MARSIFALVDDAAHADDVLRRLQDRGIATDKVSVLFADRHRARDFAAGHDAHSEGAATGVGLGSVVGGALGMLAVVGSLVIPGLGLFIVAGPLMVLLGALVGAAFGGLAGTLRGLGLPSAIAEFYLKRVQEGAVLVAVESDTMDGIETAREVLIEVNAEEIHATVEPEVDYTRGPSRHRPS
jgi:hypothetical protein